MGNKSPSNKKKDDKSKKDNKKQNGSSKKDQGSTASAAATIDPDLKKKIDSPNTIYNKKGSMAIIQSINPNPAVGEALKNVPLFRSLTDQERAKIGGALEERNFQPGSLVYQEGDSAKVFYIIKEGKASVLKADPETKNEEFLRELVPGDHFGESALLTDDDHLNASVRADSYLVLWTLHKLHFKKLFKPERINIAFATRDALTGEARGAVNAGLMDEKVDSPIPRVNMTEREKEDILTSLAKNPISRSQLFAHFDEKNLDLVVQTMELRALKAGETILEQGTEGDTYYVIQEGAVDIFQIDEATNEEVKVDHHEAGSSFGELALMHNDVRNATVKAATDVKLRELRRLWVTRVAKRIVSEEEANYVQWLNEVELLSPLTNADRARIAEALEIVVTDGGPIFKQGDEGDALYIIASGEVGFSATDPKTGQPVKMKVDTLGPGSYFGERALMKNNPRAATATANGDCKLIKLPREAVVRLLGPLEDILKKTAVSYEGDPLATEWKAAGIPFEDLTIIGVLGRGSYGYVQLVKDSAGTTYALKAISKQRIVDTHQKDHIFNEKRLMQELEFPFTIKLYDTYKDRDRLYFLLEPALGGELFPILRRMRTMPPRQAKFYAGQVTLCFKYLHSKDFIYRDLKPENLLLDTSGYLKLTDFGFLKKVPHKTYTMCGTPEYMSPEIISHNGHGRGVDWWTLGIFIFEMLASYTPFYRSGSDNMKMYERIVSGHFNFPSHVDKKARPLIRGLLQTKPHRRWGCLRSGVNQIMNDDWFDKFDWQGLKWKTLDPPMKVKVKNEFDVSNFKQSVREKPVKPYIPDGTGWDKDF